MTLNMRKQGMMMGPMKGHMAPNSSPFKPTINKLSSQYLIQDQMSSHFNKLSTTKSAVDNKPPKSMTTSVKKRDQMKREAMAKQMKLFDFEKNMKHGSPHKQYSDQQSIDMQRSFSVTVSKHGYDEVRPMTSSSLHSTHYSARSRSSSASTFRSHSRENTQTDILNRTYAGDYLDRHEERFKNVDAPFTPRLKKRPGKSFLSNSKHYAPPLVLHKETKRKVATKSEPVISEPETFHQERPSGYSHGLNVATMNTTTEHSASSDEEHQEWTADQSEILRRLTLDNTYNDGAFQIRENRDTFKPQSNTKNSFFGQSSLGKSFARYDDQQYETKYRINENDSELKYLEFINGVTNDILTRGIYSDRVLTKVMERHLEQNRGRLNEGRMRMMLLKLQEDLGVSSNWSLTETRRSHSASEITNKSQGGRVSPGRKRSPRKTPQRSRNAVVASSGTSGSEASASGRVKSAKKGILKNPGSRSSGSEQDIKSSNISSGDEQEKRKSGTRTFTEELNNSFVSEPATAVKEVAGSSVSHRDTKHVSPSTSPRNSEPGSKSVSASHMEDPNNRAETSPQASRQSMKVSHSGSKHRNIDGINSVQGKSEIDGNEVQNTAEEHDSEDDF